MKWSFWIELYIRTHCVARGLRPLTVAAYEDALQQFREWVRTTLEDRAPDQLTARDVLAYLQHLREVRGNGDSAVNRAATLLSRHSGHGLSGSRCESLDRFPVDQGCTAQAARRSFYRADEPIAS